MNIEQIQKTIVNEFCQLPDWLQKYEYLIELGKKFPSQGNSFRTDRFALPGCQSQVWLDAQIRNNKIIYKADSDSLIIKGILSLLTKVFDGQSPADIGGADLFFLESTGLSSTLSPTRANGVLAIVKQMKLLARKFEQ